MLRQIILSTLEREALLAPPVNHDDLIRWYTFSELELALVRQRRDDANRLSLAVQLCLLRYPGRGLAVNAPPSLPLWAAHGWKRGPQPERVEESVLIEWPADKLASTRY